MDWNRAHDTAAAITPAAPTVVESCWQLRTPRGRVITCAIYRDVAPGFDVRCGFSDDDLLRSQRASALGRARAISEAWKLAAIKKGFMEIVGEGRGGP